MVMKARPGLPVIVITSSRDEDVAATLRKFQVVDILHKPVSGGDGAGGGGQGPRRALPERRPDPAVPSREIVPL